MTPQPIKTLLGLAAAVVLLFCVMRIGFALQRIDPADVVADGPVCVAAGVGPAGASCHFKAALAGRLGGGWTVTPALPGARQVEADHISYSYERAAWRMAGGGALLLPIFVLLLAATPLLLRLRGRSGKARL
jgi:hypothetical protein